MIPARSATIRSAVEHESVRALIARARQGCDWWLDGARLVLPPHIRRRLFGDSAKILLLSPEDRGVRANLVDGDFRDSVFIPSPADCLMALDDWLAWMKRERRAFRLGVVVARSDVLRRAFSIPDAAVASLPELLDQAVLRRTPFLLDEVWHGATLTREGARLRKVHHTIVRRDLARAAMAQLGVEEQDVDFLSAGTGDDGAEHVIALRGAEQVVPPFAKTAVLYSLAAAACATLLAVAAFDWQQSSAQAALEARLDGARTRLAQGGARAEALSALSVRRAAPNALQIWAELSRLMPDDTFLKELRIGDESGTLLGFSSNASLLVHRIDASRLFKNATLVGSIEPSAAEGKDGFTLTFELRSKRSSDRRHAGGRSADIGGLL